MIDNMELKVIWDSSKERKQKTVFSQRALRTSVVLHHCRVDLQRKRGSLDEFSCLVARFLKNMPL